MSELFRAGDRVHHKPTGETWKLAVDQDGPDVMPCGWPQTLARADDCELIRRATPEGRIKMLEECAAMPHQSDMRAVKAKRQLLSD